jgi:hypothetical protein
MTTYYFDLWRHKKTGRIYWRMVSCLDCTNSRDGTQVIVYCPDDEQTTIYVREWTEFEDRFEPVSPFTEITKS